MRAVLWDLDGTLVDSAEFHWQSWRDTLAAEGVSITYEQFLDSFGQKNDRILPKWLGAGTAVDRIQRVGDAKEAEYRRLVQQHGLTALPGAAAWVARLHDEGWKQAIASSAPRVNAEAMLNALHLARYFDAIVSAEDVSAGKPDPQVFVKAADQLSVPANRCIVVEDAAVGIEAARRAGMKCVGVSRTPLAGADVAAVSLAELSPDTFDRLLGLEL
jgi:beta-phosphoglucomutase family hydrolase